MKTEQAPMCSKCGSFDGPSHSCVTGPAETDRERIIRELKDAVRWYALWHVDGGTDWYLKVDDAIAIVRGERDE